VPSYLVERPAAIDPGWLSDVATVGLTAGASVPEVLVGEAIERLRALRPITIESLDGVVEDIEFRLPARLAAHAAAAP